MSKDPKSYNQPGTPTLIEQDSAGLGQAVLTLTHELYVLSDRVSVLERVLEKHNINVIEEIESYTPSEEERALSDQKGRRLVQKVIDALAHNS